MGSAGVEHGEGLPEGCDCCGRDPEDCGMLEEGWVDDAQFLAGGGTYCRACAHLLRLLRLAESCRWCGVAMVEEERAELEGWAYYADEIGILHPCCPGCLSELFGIRERVSHRRGA